MVNENPLVHHVLPFHLAIEGLVLECLQSMHLSLQVETLVAGAILRDPLSRNLPEYQV